MITNTEVLALINTIRGSFGSLDVVLAESPAVDAGTLGALTARLWSIEQALTKISGITMNQQDSDAIHVLRVIHDHRDVAGLAGQARAAATRGNRRSMHASDFEGRYDISRIAGNDDPDRHLSVIRAVGKRRATPS